MAFLIYDKQNSRTVPWSELDKIVYSLWYNGNKENGNSEFTKPHDHTFFPDTELGREMYLEQENWYMTLGRAIHESQADTWQDVMKYFRMKYKYLIMQNELTLDKLIPKYTKIIRHFMWMNYYPSYTGKEFKRATHYRAIRE